MTLVYILFGIVTAFHFWCDNSLVLFFGVCCFSINWGILNLVEGAGDEGEVDEGDSGVDGEVIN